MRTLEQIEGDVWPDQADETTLMRKCRLLRQKPIDQFSAEDYRLLVGQGIGLPTLAPRVITLLETDPLIQGDFSPGDLLGALLRPSNWRQLDQYRTKLIGVCDCALKALELADDGLPSNTDLETSIHEFLNSTRK